MSNLKWVSFAVVPLALIASAPCSAQTWIKMKGGAFSITPEIVSEVKATLRERIYKEGDLPAEWSKYVLQFRAVRVSGRRAIEIHGACAISTVAGMDLEKDVFQFADGGKCFFQVFYDLKSKRYSNILFNGDA